jgi:hypothetical protein
MDPADFPPPAPSTSTSGGALNPNAYPALSAPPAAPTQPKAAKKPQNKSTAAGGWSEALSAVGLSGAAGTGKNATKKKLTVIKASTSNSSLSKMGEEGGSVSPTIPPTASGKAASALPPGISWDDFKPVAKKDEKQESEWRAASSAAPVSGVKSTPVAATAPPRAPVGGAAAASSAGSARPHGGWAKIGGAGKEHGGDSQPASAVPYKSSQDYPTLGSSSRTK